MWHHNDIVAATLQWFQFVIQFITIQVIMYNIIIIIIIIIAVMPRQAAEISLGRVAELPFDGEVFDVR